MYDRELASIAIVGQARATAASVERTYQTSTSSTTVPHRRQHKRVAGVPSRLNIESISMIAYYLITRQETSSRFGG
ncbi:hypothetical protein C7B80_25065 [Cyanosarcina cf. burmensis CCALA 770]|nr:hypothetical protein C7B80_25065 [Cyanosarcina cf. burmensis CCALA 770]